MTRANGQLTGSWRSTVRACKMHAIIQQYQSSRPAPPPRAREPCPAARPSPPPCWPPPPLPRRPARPTRSCRGSARPTSPQQVPRGGRLPPLSIRPPWPPIAAPAAPNATLRGNPDAQSLNSRGMRLAFPSVRPRPDTRRHSGELGGALFQHARQPRPARLLGGSLLLPIRFHLRCVRARRAQREAPPAAKKK